MSFARPMRHLFTTRWSTRNRFPQATLDAIEQAITDCEHRHGGEIRFVVETALDLPDIARGLSPRDRALQVFGQFRVWDTAHNNGVLIYVLLADRDVEIIADRGIAKEVPQSEWQAVCRQMEGHFRAGRFKDGSVVGILGVGALLGRHFPGERGGSDNELPNQPVLL
ncbi:MAG: TPM domain-containing protein [Proteobacteria bacterium]|nr:TPM domain-containing protein [Pseudomonadota bacterium]